MEVNKLVFAGLAAGCLAAAGAGAFLAVRLSQPSPAAGSSAPAALSGEPRAPGQPVNESEGVIAPGPGGASGSSQPPAPDVDASSARRTAARGADELSRAERRPAAPRTGAAASSRPALARSSPPPAAEPPAASAASGSMWEPRPSVEPARPEPESREPEPPPPPPAPEFIDLTVPADAVLGLQIERTISSETAKVEDRVEARLTRDVRVSDRIAIPAGSTVRGSVVDVERGGRMRGKARLAVRFHTLVLADGTQLALKTDPVVREGPSPAGESAAKVGGAAVGGAILGAILGGSKGAAIGGAVGAAGGTAAAMTNDRNPAIFAAGTTVTVRMLSPVSVTVQKE